MKYIYGYILYYFYTDPRPPISPSIFSAPDLPNTPSTSSIDLNDDRTPPASMWNSTETIRPSRTPLLLYIFINSLNI